MTLAHALPLLAALTAAPLVAQQVPEGTPLPRHMTPAEAQLWSSWSVPRGVGTNPPEGLIWCPPEYAPMDGIIVAWEGANSWKDILAEMGGHVTTTGDADYYVSVDTSGEIAAADAALLSFGANLARVKYIVTGTDSIWMRDYGPRYVYQGDVRVIVDHHYNRPRPNDDSFPTAFSFHKEHLRYHNDVIHGGGNFHLDANGVGYATRLIVNENPGRTEQEIFDIYRDFQALETLFLDPFPTNIDATQHLDMWMQVIADDAVIISDWPTQTGSIQDNICDQTAADMAMRGFTVHRVPAVSSGTHYTYTNVVMCNDLVLIPSYTNSLASGFNATALATWQAALPNKTIVQVPAQNIVTAAGVLHCIVMHLPEARGNGSPTAYLLQPLDGAILSRVAVQEAAWISDDDEDVTVADLAWSADGGQSWASIGSALSPTGVQNWFVPGGAATNAGQVRVTVQDGAGNSGEYVAQVAVAGPGEACWTRFGAGKAGTNGVPDLGLSNAPVLGGPVAVEITNGFPNRTAKLVRGLSRAQRPLYGTIAWTEPGLVIDVPLDANGDGALAATVPAAPALNGLELYWQAWIPGDPGAAGNVSATNGVRCRIGN